MIKTEQVHEGRMQIAEVHAAFFDAAAIVIGSPMHMPRLHTTACKPEGKGLMLVSGLVLVRAWL